MPMVTTCTLQSKRSNYCWAYQATTPPWWGGLANSWSCHQRTDRRVPSSNSWLPGTVARRWNIRSWKLSNTRHWPKEWNRMLESSPLWFLWYSYIRDIRESSSFILCNIKTINGTLNCIQLHGFHQKCIEQIIIHQVRQLQIRNQRIGLGRPVRIGRNSHFLFHLLTARVPRGSFRTESSCRQSGSYELQ